jgi:hypothetical protein
MATNLVKDFRTKNRIYGEAGAFFAAGIDNISIDTGGRILSSGEDLFDIFAGALSGGAPLTFGSNLTATSPSYDSGTPVTVGVSFNPTFGSVSATSFVGSLNGNANTATKWAAPITITLSGDVAGSVTFDGSGNVATTEIQIQPNSVALGTDTTGNYVATVVAGSGLQVTGVGVENSTATVGHSTVGGTSIASTNSNGTVVQSLGVTVDSYGHVTETSVGTVDLDTRYYTETEIDQKFSAVGSASGNWEATYTAFSTQSANNLSVYATFNSVSGTIIDAIEEGTTQGQIKYSVLGSTSFTDVDVNGLQTGDSPVFAGLTITGNTTVQGNLSVTGDFTYLDTIVSITSALSVVNAGTGPALYVQQDGVQPIAHFIDSNGDDIVFADNGYVGLGVFNPGEKLTVVGNISASGTVTAATNTNTTSNDVIVQTATNTLEKRAIDSRVWGTTLVDNGGVNLTANSIPKASDADTLTNSNITDNGTTISLGSNATVSGTLSASGTLSTPQVTLETGTKDLNKKLFVATVGTGGTAVTTFPVANMVAAKFSVVLVNGNNRTAFEVLATIETTGNTTSGTVYAIIDNQAQTQLTDVDVSVSGGNYILTITSFVDTTTALIDGTAFYNS